MKTYQLIDTSSYCNLHTKISISAKWAEKNEKDRKSPPFCHECRAPVIISIISVFLAAVPLGSTESPPFGSLYFSINFLAALSWCLITLRNSWLSCKIFR